jgi:hypothetical protein
MNTGRAALLATGQSLTIKDWHPRTNVNGDNARRHWSVIRRNHDIDRDMAWASAKQAGWVFVSGRVKLTITLVYPRKYRVDADNLAARCKGLIDGLKQVSMPYIHTGRANCCRRWRSGGSCQYLEKGNVLERIVESEGFFTDDSTEWLDLEVRAAVERGVKETQITLTSVEQPISAAASRLPIDACIKETH